jgi:putative Mn2+ efflux pump MntP
MVVLALVIGIVPQFTDCQSQGRALELPTGKTVAMKCHWSATAELALAIPIAAVGVLLGFSRRKESMRNLSILGIVLGAVTILVPTVLIGVCASADMLCNSVMRPLLILMGVLLVVISVVTLLASNRITEQPA